MLARLLSFALLLCSCKAAPTEAVKPEPAPLASTSSQPAALVSALPVAPPSREQPCKLVGKMKHWRYDPTVTQLSASEVLIAGGRHHDGSEYLKEAEIFDLATGETRPISPMADEHAMAAAARLPDGGVLVVGGMSALVEVFDPGKKRWKTVGKLDRPAVNQLAVTLLGGDVLIAGGDLMWKGAVSEEVHVYHPREGKLEKMPSSPEPVDYVHGYLAKDGRVILMGREETGLSPGTVTHTFLTAKGVVKDAAADPVAKALRARSDGTSRLVRGPRGKGPALLVTEKLVLSFDEESKAFVPAATLTQERTAAGSTALDDGRVVVAGGLRPEDGTVEVCSL